MRWFSNSLDLTLSPFRTLSPAWALLLLSLLAGFLMLLIFRYTSDHQRVKETKNAIKAHLGDEKIELLEKATLEASSGVTIETLPLRIPLTKELNWRIRAQTVGLHKI